MLAVILLCGSFPAMSFAEEPAMETVSVEPETEAEAKEPEEPETPAHQLTEEPDEDRSGAETEEPSAVPAENGEEASLEEEPEAAQDQPDKAEPEVNEKEPENIPENSAEPEAAREPGMSEPEPDVPEMVPEEEETEAPAAGVLYPWEELDDEAFIEWITDPAQKEYIRSLLNARSNEFTLLLARIDAIPDEAARDTVYTYLDSLSDIPGEDETAENEEDAAEKEELPEDEEETPVPEEDSQNGEPAAGELEEETDIETIEPSESPFPGPAAEFSLSKKQIEQKEALRDSGAVERLAELTEGKDYEAGILYFVCSDRGYAEEVAAIYGAELKSYSYGIARIKLTGGTVKEAVALAADPDNLYPPVGPNYITPFEEEPPKRLLASGSAKTEVPVSENWDSWVNGEDAILSNPDAFLLYPSASNYQWQHDMINTYEAWGVTTGDPDILVAVIDSGVETSHPDLHNVSTLDIGCGIDPTADHGTHVAGIIAATLGNGIGGAGIAPGVSVLSIRVTRSDGIYDADIAAAVNEAVSNGADIINISIGGVGSDVNLNEALTDAYNAGVTVIASAGNNGDNTKMFPAGYSTVIAVGNVDRSEKRAPSSSYGSWVDISAPGEDIWSTARSGYTKMSGTSMAAPMVAGVAALYMSRMGHVSPSTMRSVLKSSVTKTSSSGMGAGIINAAAMFTKDKAAPSFELDGGIVSGTVSASVDSRLWFTGRNDDGAVIYTLNGTTPTVANGKITRGSLCEDGYIDLKDIGPAGTSWTIKAAFVSNIGVRSNVATLKVTLKPSAYISRLHIDAPAELKAGKSVTLGVRAEPENASKDVYWTIVNKNGAPNATLSSTGVFKSLSTDFGIVTVRATSKADGSVYDEAVIEIGSVDLVRSISLSSGTGMIFSKTTPTHKQLTVKFKTKSGAVWGQAPEDSYDGIRAAWKSSNIKVVTVDGYGYLTAVGTGTAYVTCRALDGSGLSKKCKVTVKRGADSLNVTGQLSVAPGTSATFKAAFTPTNTANKSVTWSLEDAPAGVTISTKGKVTVPYGTEETVFTVCAKAKDGSAVIGRKQVRIAPRVSYIGLEMPDPEQGVRYTTSYGILKTLTLYNVDLPETDRTENMVDLDFSCIGPAGSVVWSSSNAAVASVDENGVVTPKKKGTVTIYAKANDGSGKKTSVKVYVKVPASSLTIVPARRSEAAVNGKYITTCFIGTGCSVTNKVKLGDAYGTPSTGTVKWSIGSITLDGVDVTQQWKAKGWAKVSSSGKLTISKNARTTVYYSYDEEAYLTLEAIRTEEGILAEYVYVINPKVTSLSVSPKSVRLTVQPNKDGAYYLLKDSIPIFTNYDRDGCFTVSSSNPTVAGASVLSGNYVQIYGGTKAGTATVTVKANDGSGKYAKIKVTVTN